MTTATKSSMVHNPIGPQERRFAVMSRNGARATASVLRGRCDYLRHWAHYFDVSSSMRSYAVENYMAHADAVGAWG